MAYGSLTDLAKRARIPRTAAYRPIQSLIGAGFLLPLTIGKRTHYQAAPINQLSSILDRKKTALESLVPELSNVLTLVGNEIDVTYYPGVEGLSRASDIFLEETSTKIWKIFENPLHTLEVAGIAQTEQYVRRRVAKGIVARVVAPAEITNSAWLREKNAKNRDELREVILVSRRTYPLDASIVSNGQSVLILVVHDAIFAVFIRNVILSRTVASIHDMVWDRFHVEN